jgi:hypothetical protein
MCLSDYNCSSLLALSTSLHAGVMVSCRLPIKGGPSTSRRVTAVAPHQNRRATILTKSILNWTTWFDPGEVINKLNLFCALECSIICTFWNWSYGVNFPVTSIRSLMSRFATEAQLHLHSPLDMYSSARHGCCFSSWSRELVKTGIGYRKPQV